jgi:hypothetical protein
LLLAGKEVSDVSSSLDTGAVLAVAPAPRLKQKEKCVEEQKKGVYL